MQTSILISFLILLLSLDDTITVHGIPLAHANTQHHPPYTIALSPPAAAHSTSLKRIRRSTIPAESLSQASAKLRQIINANGGFSKVNSDPLAAYNVISSATVQSDPILRDAVMFNPTGHQCSVALCSSIGQVQISLGACTASYCHCGSGKAFVKSCGQGTVYDAFLQICNWLENVEYCT